MKFLIWLMSVFVTSVTVWIINLSGITLGAIPTIIIYIPMFLVAPKLCKKWEAYKNNKKNNGATLDNTSNVNIIMSKPDFVQYVPKEYPQAVTITEIYNLNTHCGKFVKLEIPNLNNPKTSVLRVSEIPYSMEYRNRILEEPLTELHHATIRGVTLLRIEPISAIRAKSYEDSHYIYGILRRDPKKDFVLTCATIVLSDSHLRIIEQELDKQGLFEYVELDDGTISIFDFCSESVENLEIPEHIDGKIVSSIQAWAFARNEVIKTLKIPNSVKSIGRHSFSCCDKLEAVYIGDAVQKLDYVFYSCNELKNVYIGKSVSVISNCFSGCPKHVTFNVNPDNKYFCEIDGVLFSKDKTALVCCPCGKNGKYIIPQGTKLICDGAFEGTGLNEIIISDTVQKICDAFDYASNIKKIIIPSSVVEIAPYAISSEVKGYECEIVIEQGSYAQQYFQEYKEDYYNVVVLDKQPTKEKSVLMDTDVVNKLFCRRCGAQLPLDSEFCFKCGTKVVCCDT